MTKHFQIFCKRILAVVIMFLHINCDYSQTYLGRNMGHTTVPNDIGDGMTDIIISKNRISHINDECFDETSADFNNVSDL